MKFKTLPKLRKGDKVAILSPSFAAPGAWPHVHELGLQRIANDFGLDPVEYPATRKIGASKNERAKDLLDAFRNPLIKAVITTLGGDDQVTYVKNLSGKVFTDNPKPFFGYSDNTNFINHLWLNGIPAYYGGCVFTEFAMQGEMDKLTVEYLKHALFENGEFELKASNRFNDIGLDWGNKLLLHTHRRYQKNEGWFWNGDKYSNGTTWGGCVESLDDLLKIGVTIPTLKDFENIVLFTETSEEMPTHQTVRSFFRALGELGILERIQGLLVGRPKAWEFDNPRTDHEKALYKAKQRNTILETVRQYNKTCPLVQNLDFGHTSPQICLPVGRKIRIDSKHKKLFCEF